MREIRREPRGWARPAFEAALWALLGALIVIELSGVRDRPPVLEACLLLAALAVAAALSRPLPFVSLGVMLSGAVLQTSASGFLVVETTVISPWLAVAVLALLTGLRSERVRPVVTMVVVACSFTLVLHLSAGLVFGAGVRAFLSDSVDWLGVVLVIALSTLTPWLFGRYQRLRRRVWRGGWEIAERMERTRAAEADRARLRERARIATRMHDSLGHDLALIAVRAAALEMTALEDSEQGRAAGELRTAAHEANLRLREIIGVLREDDGGDGHGEAASGPGAGGPKAGALNTDDPGTGESVAALVQRASDAGMRVRLLREGPDPDPAAPGGGAVHRVVQEALTNAAKYAPEAEVTVRVVRESDRTRVSVSDTGPPGAVRTVLPARSGGGSGLAGLRALVEELDGSFAVGRGEGAGFTVRATVPDPGAEGGAEELGESETHRAHSEARARARRRLVAAVAVPAALGLGLAAVGLGLLSWVGVNTVLSPERYGRLTVGDDRERVEEVLPRFSYPEHSVSARASEPPAPPGARCLFYLSRYENGLPPVYRLCFEDGVLVAKDELQRTD
ncbi:sensor histidine kinase [Nocardiopsis dassonvillei]|uniref:histidine kinase n=1 Tax=Nocardiopsis dassonvillei (strain ATCC 23218 / DSM 43111 / CIP 107115 / JCM 7437 / KCTC 9190 / NBRC 14626 / NCTC 10488 / NRRL B-5397 / IMRU 509) TaxID=446468 RepID=D7AVY2_NOCDD|nr:ATP-binding protein [Nocardiopsis dassonvillei]ADH69642.1 integral membrane sensor signal transduction histidine kinase [Nocardiopsis dassonvillei subsp. dassonvillei DSM 43111]NKY78167.1 two-component sensor histidine kinase [Nocardiopsis dassonvillei]VEI90155.1 Nitrate/nitrite sensor protein narX [Nocardiopsis dassonvillei]